MNPVPFAHRTTREGVRLGILTATAFWLWIAIVDVAAGDPFRTFLLLGGVALFTVLVYLVNLAFGLIVVFTIHGADREPSLVFAVAFGVVFVEFGLAMLTLLLSHTGLGDLAWVRVFIGSLFGAVVAWLVLRRRHRLLELVRRADAEEDE